MSDPELLTAMRSMVIADAPSNFTTIRNGELARLVTIIDGLVPVLDRLEELLAAGANINLIGDEWWLFNAEGGLIVSGATIREMLVQLIFHEET